MSYAAFNVVFGEQPSAAKWNILGTNDASFNDGTGIGTGAITAPKIGTDSTFAWTSYTPTISNFAIGNGTLLAKYNQIGKRILARISITAGSTTTLTGPIAFTFPVTPSSSYASEGRLVMGEGEFYSNGGSTAYDLIVEGNQSTSTVGLSHKIVNGNYSILQTLGTAGNTPVAIGTGDVIVCLFSYEAA